MLPTSGLFPAALLGAWRLGRTVVPLNYLLSPEDLAQAAEALPEAQLQLADALTAPWPTGTWVIANPPWCSFSGRQRSTADEPVFELDAKGPALGLQQLPGDAHPNAQPGGTAQAPAAGTLSNVTLQQGEYVEIGDPLLALVTSDQPWVEANLSPPVAWW